MKEKKKEEKPYFVLLTLESHQCEHSLSGELFLKLHRPSRRQMPGGIRVWPKRKAAVWKTWLMPGWTSTLYPRYSVRFCPKKAGTYSQAMIFCKLEKMSESLMATNSDDGRWRKVIGNCRQKVGTRISHENIIFMVENVRVILHEY